MKKLKLIKFDNGLEGFTEGNITVKLSDTKQVSNSEVLLKEDDAKKLLDYTAYFKLEGNIVKAKTKKELSNKLKTNFDEVHKKIKKINTTKE